MDTPVQEEAGTGLALAPMKRAAKLMEEMRVSLENMLSDEQKMLEMAEDAICRLDAAEPMSRQDPKPTCFYRQNLPPSTLSQKFLPSIQQVEVTKVFPL
jgi:hypothetical protein